ncbi:MAG: hypothetical protein JXB26_07445 [Candidatus Aminicenantes bacterium]|nr:hypothetical protein [Candidatus Aminicenantes bacterium]
MNTDSYIPWDLYRPIPKSRKKFPCSFRRFGEKLLSKAQEALAEMSREKSLEACRAVCANGIDIAYRINDLKSFW